MSSQGNRIAVGVHYGRTVENADGMSSPTTGPSLPTDALDGRIRWTHYDGRIMNGWIRDRRIRIKII